MNIYKLESVWAHYLCQCPSAFWASYADTHCSEVQEGLQHAAPPGREPRRGYCDSKITMGNVVIGRGKKEGKRWGESLGQFLSHDI